MRKIRTYKKWGIYQATGEEANYIGGAYAAFLPGYSPAQMDSPEWAADNLTELIDFIDTYNR